MKKVLAVLAVAGLASSAMAQSFSFDARVALRQDHTNNSTPTVLPGGVIELEAGTHNLQVLFGAFNAQGFTNGGLFNFLGTVSVADGGAAIQRGTDGFGPGRRAPYNFGPADGATGQQSSLSFDAARDLLTPVTPGTITVPWNFGDPQPTGEGLAYSGAGAPDTYHPGYRFSIVITDNTAREFELTIGGPMQAIRGWFGTSVIEPEDEETPGSVTFTPVLFVDGEASATFTIRVIPAPGAAALLGLGGLVAARRRR